MQNSRLVYSTDGGRINDDSNKQESRSVNKDGIARIHRETKGRKGKGVSIITGLDKDAAALKDLCTTLKKKCGCGGAVKDGTIELQTDARDKIQQLLKQLGIESKIAGG
ncbi:stress response translation initiation inhibitor YciH [Aestuariibacter sp. GS-14]|uniref:stress response translation initiation inhibitor YciH n=1 Tax=Aestuariibacter sp. GS-14 TaxID=2590670 RepID=UPI00112A6D91|nr:stress response translation initiation inhibitor YciH [Aestuariibacter sp. GS-14]TPV61721.1 stress response translation initiation inhibitor YciH [Aestuariibacter sp. GS-14]